MTTHVGPWPRPRDITAADHRPVGGATSIGRLSLDLLAGIPVSDYAAPTAG